MARKPPVQSSTTSSLPRLRISHSEAYQKIEAQIQKGKELDKRVIHSQESLEQTQTDSDKWRDYNIRLLLHLFDNPSLADDYRNKTHQVVYPLDFVQNKDYIKRLIKTRIKELESILESLDVIEEVKDQPASDLTLIDIDAVGKIELLAKRLGLIARTLEERSQKRTPLIIEDEFDVQYLFKGLMKLFFDDIRPEEWTPSYAGKSTRSDFLIKDERIFVELKMTRDGLKTTKQVGEELIIDIHHYRVHPDCNTLIAVVYDPARYINEPKSLENDLSRTFDGKTVKVIIVQS